MKTEGIAGAGTCRRRELPAWESAGVGVADGFINLWRGGSPHRPREDGAWPVRRGGYGDPPRWMDGAAYAPGYLAAFFFPAFAALGGAAFEGFSPLRIAAVYWVARWT